MDASSSHRRFNKLLLTLFIFTAPTVARAGNLAVSPVGEFGGLRIFTVCYSKGLQHLCSIDTGAPMSIAATGDIFDGFPVVSQKDLKGVGNVDFACPVIQADDFEVSGRLLPSLQLLRCSNFSLILSPMLGMSVIDKQAITFDFPAGLLEWKIPHDLKLQPLVRGAFGGTGFLIPVQIAQLNLTAGFDTGSPVTLIDIKVVISHPDVFLPSDRPASAELAAAGISVFKLKSPIRIGNMALSADYIEATDLSQFSDKTGHIDLLLGANHITHARWSFDLVHDLFVVSDH